VFFWTNTLDAGRLAGSRASRVNSIASLFNNAQLNSTTPALSSDRGDILVAADVNPRLDRQLLVVRTAQPVLM
jgi:hypothetical protein